MTIHHECMMAENGTDEVTTVTTGVAAEAGDVAQKEAQREFEIVEWFKNKIKESRVTFVVYYRGYW